MVEDWKEAISSDESTFCSRCDPGYIYEVHSSSRCPVNVWGAVSKDDLDPLVRLSRSFTVVAYCEFLDNHLLPYALDGLY
ncbi:hypothetical protein HPB51_000114 [Rhipicephalus microplus]|uniref:Uncharacterized protein n=1 Tax=Rhipicephalus microplus TaxID=6941 RepID=A0A9J6DRB4_RHIMP|nr:hypothetical protein HPB51_000114 [Rhipicephalus microplus]